MSSSRYKNDNVIQGGQIRSSARAIVRIRLAMRRGDLNYTQLVLKQGQRLDSLAGEILGDGRLWWLLAVMSDIGWGIQVPPGTVIKYPIALGDALRYV